MGLGMSLLWSLLWLGQTGEMVQPGMATVTAPEVEVRSGPGQLYYPTQKVRAGTEIKVWRVVNGWAEISPPPGAFSLVPKKAISQLSTSTGKVNRGGVETLIGSDLVKDAQRTGRKLEPGHLVQIQTTEWVRTAEGPQEFFRILPDGERRFIPAAALAQGGSEIVQTQLAQPAPDGTPDAAVTTPTELPAAVTANLRAAEQAYRHGELTGDWTEARRLYGELAQSPFHYVRMTALNRLEFIRQRLGQPPPGPPPSGINVAMAGGPSGPRYDPNTGQWRPATDAPRSFTPPAGPAPGPVATRETFPTSREVMPQQVTRPQERPNMPVSGTTRPVVPIQGMQNPAPPAVGPRWTPGLLRQAYQRHAGQPLYYLVDGEHNLKCFVSPGPGVDLASYVDRNVEVIGSLALPRADLNNKPHMTVSQVRHLAKQP